MDGILVNLIIIIISIVIGIIIGIVRKDHTDDSSEQISGWGLYGLILGALLSWGVWGFDSTYVHDTTEHYLYVYSLRNQEKTSGDFFLGSGTVEQTEYYYYYYKSNYGYERGKLPTSNVSIVETNKRPEIVERCKVYKGKFFKWNNTSIDRYIMYVPKGTVIKQFRAY